MSNEQNGAGIAQNEQGAEAAPSAAEAGVATAAEADTPQKEAEQTAEAQGAEGQSEDAPGAEETVPQDVATEGRAEVQPTADAPTAEHTDGQPTGDGGKGGDGNEPPKPAQPHAAAGITMKELFRRLRIYAELSNRHLKQILSFASIPEKTDDVNAWAFNLGQCRQLAKTIIECHDSLFLMPRATPANAGQPAPTAAPAPHCNETVVDGGSNTVSPEQPASEGCDGSPAAPTAADTSAADSPAADSPAAPTAPYHGEPRKVDDGLKQADDEGAHGTERLPVDKPYHGESRRIDDDGSIHYNRPLRGVMRSTMPQQFMDATTGMVVNHP